MEKQNKYKIIILQSKFFAQIEIRKVLSNVDEVLISSVEPFYCMLQIQEALRYLVKSGFMTDDERRILVKRVLGSLRNFPRTEQEMSEEAKEHQRSFIESTRIIKN